MNLTFYSTPSHGYLRVPKSTFIKVGGNPNEISGYSGIDLTTLYLEEDSDASYFMNLLESKGIEFKINCKYVNSVANTHNYNPNYFNFEAKTGDKVLLYDDSTATVNRINGILYVSDGIGKYKIPTSNPFKYIKSVI
jgi:hypothetical protein